LVPVSNIPPEEEDSRRRVGLNSFSQRWRDFGSSDSDYKQVAHPLRNRPVPGKSEQCPRARVILRKPGPFEWSITPNQWRRNAVMRGRHSGNDDQAENDAAKTEMDASPTSQPTNVLA
jgi:hypothetical protein